MISSFETTLALKKLMQLMEVDLGIDALSDDAKTLLVAISDVQNSDGSFIAMLRATMNLLIRCLKLHIIVRSRHLFMISSSNYTLRTKSLIMF